MAAVCLFMGIVLLSVISYFLIYSRCPEDGCCGKLVRITEEKESDQFRGKIARIQFRRCTKNPNHEFDFKTIILPIPVVKQPAVPTPKAHLSHREIWKKIVVLAHTLPIPDRIREILHDRHW